MLRGLFKPKPARIAGDALYARVVAQARQPALYTDLGVPDSVEGRFELYSLHVYLLLERIKDTGEQSSEVGQALFDIYLSGLDNALRELGVGDTVVGKRMRKLGAAFYGRVQSYEAALAALPDREQLDALVARTVYAQGGAEHAPALADYVMAQREALANQPLAKILSGDAEWRQP